ncbi:MAG: PilX N-terminal domain-containing pilus assembly protein [Burkholderiaceae bacterium]|nr:PilX N-terminal domain-containing pilus assembly protein [Burkholderiaceae bacterium]
MDSHPYHLGLPQRQPARRVLRASQRGASLVVSLLMLVAVLLLGISAASMALQGEKAARGDRDRQIAFQAAEAALMDAEIDIENSTASNSRSALFKEKDVQVELFITGCGAGTANQSLGLCQPAAAGQTPVWLAVDFSDTGASSTKSVPYGFFTGQTMQTGIGATPARLPRYIIEIFVDNQAGGSTSPEEASYIYRVTAIGYGMRDSTKVTLQTFYRKVEKT